MTMVAMGTKIDKVTEDEENRPRTMGIEAVEEVALEALWKVMLLNSKDNIIGTNRRVFIHFSLPTAIHSGGCIEAGGHSVCRLG